MNEHKSFRAGWAKYSLLAALMVGGVAGGLYLASESSRPQPPYNMVKDAGPAPPPESMTHRFPLSTWDAKDTAEAPCDRRGWRGAGVCDLGLQDR